MTVRELLERLSKLAEVKDDVDRNVAVTEAHATEVAAQLEELIMHYAGLSM